MRFTWILLFLATTSCATDPSYQYIRGGETVNQPGVSFVLPESRSWVAIIRSTYEAAFGASDMPKNDTLIVGVRIYNAPLYADKQEFLEAVKKDRGAGPEIGRFKIIRNNEELSSTRSETCVEHKSASKDFGVEAKRGGEYSILETYGMNCIHPIKPQVGVLVELSRKAPPGTKFPEFDAMAKALLRSAKFGEF